MKILVTGMVGFIGGHLYDRLISHHTVLGLDKKLGTSTADLNFLTTQVEQFKPDMIVHLGANCSSQRSLRDPVMDFTDNAIGTFNVCEAARKSKIPVIFNSTMKVYPGEDGLISPYGLSKITGENYLEMYNEIYGLPYIINRPSSVYGPRQDASEDGGWFTWFTQAAVSGQTITLFGDGTQSRDVLYIDDHIALLVDQIENFGLYENKQFNFGGGLDNEVSLNQLLDALDYHNIKTKPRLPGDVQRFVNENEYVSSINGWQPQVSWQEGLDKLLAYYA